MAGLNPGSELLSKHAELSADTKRRLLEEAEQSLARGELENWLNAQGLALDRIVAWRLARDQCAFNGPLRPADAGRTNSTEPRRATRAGTESENAHAPIDAMDVVRLLAGGANNREIAEMLRCSERTVRRKVEQAVNELGARNRTEAVARAIKEKLI